MCNKPRKPHRKPKPSATEVSGWYTKAESFNLNLSRASRRSSKSSESVGYKPLYTIGFTSLYPGKGSDAPFLLWVIVSPTLVSCTSLIPAIR